MPKRNMDLIKTANRHGQLEYRAEGTDLGAVRTGTLVVFGVWLASGDFRLAYYKGERRYRTEAIAERAIVRWVS